MSLCDAIAYISHDIDDALRAGIIHLDDLPADAIRVLGRTTSERLNRMVVGLIEGSGNGQIGIVPHILEAINALRQYLYTKVYPCEAIDCEIRKAKQLLRALYQDLREKPTPEILAGDPNDSIERRTVDFVAGMTDEFALQLFKQRLLPSPWIL